MRMHEALSKREGAGTFVSDSAVLPGLGVSYRVYPCTKMGQMKWGFRIVCSSAWVISFFIEVFCVGWLSGRFFDKIRNRIGERSRP